MLNTKMNPCKNFQDELDPYLDGELSPESAEKVESHLPECEGCREYVSFQKSLLTGIKEDWKKDVPPNPYFYAGLMEKIDRQPAGPQLSWGKLAFAGSTLMLVGVFVFFSVSNKPQTEPNQVIVSAIQSASAAQPLITGLNSSDMLAFLHQEMVPVDPARTEYVRLVTGSDGRPGILVSASDEKTEAVYLHLSGLADQFFPSEKETEINAQLQKFAGILSGGILVDRKGQLLVDPSVYQLKEKIQQKLAGLLGGKVNENLENALAVLTGKGSDLVKTSLLISFPERTDLVKVSASDENDYALISMDAFTVRSLRLAVPRFSRLVSGEFQSAPEPSYAVVESQKSVFTPVQPPLVSVASASSKKESGLTVAEANQLLFSLRNGLKPEEVLAKKAALDEAFNKYLKDTQELAKQVKQQRDQDAGFKVYVPNSGGVKVVGFGASGREPDSLKKKASKKENGTTTLDNE
ncbi:MAG: zf-HC2 domain-containing protein [Bacteroidetes bacterium]|nr:zf-HC2 domain-containing protein [Bacteroidota bacterium]